MAFQQNGSSTNFFQNSQNWPLKYIHQNVATGALHDSDERYPPPSCYTNTREDVFKRIAESDKAIIVIHSRSGQGKSAIAQTLTERHEEEGTLGAAFFFDKTSPNCNNPSRLVTTLATQLARYVQGLEDGIAHAIKLHPTIAKSALKQQVDKLIIAPFQALMAANFDGAQDQVKWWVILDGLDECIATSANRRGPTRRESERAQLLVLDLVLKLQSSRLPFSFAIFTRPQRGIMDCCRQNSNVIEMFDICSLPSHETDVETFLRVALGRIAPNGRSGDEDRGEDEGEGPRQVDDDVDEDSAKPDWPDEDRMQQLIDMTRGDMLAASTVIKRIEDVEGDPDDELDRLLENGLQPDPAPEAEPTVTPSAIAGLFTGATIQQIGNIQLGGTNVYYTNPTNNVYDVNLGGSRQVHSIGPVLPHEEGQRRLT
ncbi:hypothetical protein EST38_g12815 [Candolleomyces aberdarensis]|uniref:Nephrocystin 3-like N-terminal domain-containing protein n=1 Tax=Candolleomyces aberdarensis TaxID=2316362 RepID=A0A4Q2D1H6_9AGAR|nr:hypothetical protein EST38_g12815 [Candolleomyces aberdarensis]